jgi:hypothetical protein
LAKGNRNRMKIIEEIKKKREFSGLPDSIVERAAEMAKGDVKESRALLRKYFGVFLTNKVLKGRGSAEDLLKAHMSSKKRDYEEFYREIFSGIFKNPSSEKSLRGSEGLVSIIDLGAGVNGFSYPSLRIVFGDVHYLAVEASGQLVKHMNDYFRDRGFEKAHALREDLFNVEKVVGLLRKQKKPRVVFMFQVVDALENLERDFSKKFISEISSECEKIVLTLPTESLGGRKKFAVQRKWIIDFLEEYFVIEKDFKSNGERIIVIGKKTNK